MHMQIFRVKKPSCKILKTNNCVELPFEVQYTSSMFAKTDLRLCWSHIPHCWKPHVPAQSCISSLENRLLLYASNKGTDQPLHQCSLISTFVVRLAPVLKTIFHQCVISYTCSQSNPDGSVKTEPLE